MDFDQIIQRKNTRSVKWDTHIQSGIHPEALPMWVADMDFKTDPAVISALRREVDTGIYGYTYEPEDYRKAVVGWMDRRHGWKVQPEWIVSVPGVVSGLNALLLVLTKPGDAVLIQEPVYFPFRRSILTHGRIPVSNDLILKDGHYEIDFADMEAKLRDHPIKAFILCSPHNPVGRVFSEAELTRMTDLCQSYGVKIISDEIHMDFVFTPHQHTVLAKLRPDYADSIVTLSAASKTFNLAGFKTAQLISPDPEIRHAVNAEYQKLGLHGQTTLGLLATEAAYTHGDAYVDELVAYLRGSIETVTTFLKRELPEVKLINPEGLYLLWLDFRALNKEQPELKRFLSEEAKLWFNDGSTFGSGGEGFMRVNVATPRANVEEALKRLKQALR